jgi:serine protease inhibitor
MKPFNGFLLTIAVLFFFQSCGNQQDCDCDIPELRSVTAEEAIIIEAANDFSFDIFARVNASDPDENLFISPLSISTALSMTTNGAVGETKEGIKNTLHQNALTDDEMNAAYKSLSGFLTNLDPKVVMQLANSNWYKDAYDIRSSFRDVLQDYYDAEVKPADFSDPGSRDLINGWIEDKTNGKIKEMIDQIPASAVMYLINAIYLKATWQYQFEKEKTDKQDFYLRDGSSVRTDLMYSEGVKANAYFNDAYQYAELPYGNGQFVFSVFMPDQPEKIDDFVQNLDVTQMNDMIKAADTGTFEVYLPKFKIEYKILLNDVLTAMGMEQSFGTDADFSNLFDEDLALCISRVLHQSFIEVDEEGTEAAAATVVEVIESSMPGSDPTVILINKPFAFFVREKHSNTILFAGKMLDPTIGK